MLLVCFYSIGKLICFLSWCACILLIHFFVVGLYVFIDEIFIVVVGRFLFYWLNLFFCSWYVFILLINFFVVVSMLLFLFIVLFFLKINFRTKSYNCKNPYPILHFCANGCKIYATFWKKIFNCSSCRRGEEVIQGRV